MVHVLCAQEGKLAVTRIGRFLLCVYADKVVELGLLKNKVLSTLCRFLLSDSLHCRSADFVAGGQAVRAQERVSERPVVIDDDRCWCLRGLVMTSGARTGLAFDSFAPLGGVYHRRSHANHRLPAPCNRHRCASKGASAGGQAGVLGAENELRVRRTQRGHVEMSL